MTLKIHQLEHRFVTSAPDELDEGILYISLDYNTALHRCCCGCGCEVVTPLSPARWQLTYDGETASLSPSVGNWRLPCKSHYIVRRGQVHPCATWSEQQIRQGQREDRAALAKHLSEPTPAASTTSPWWMRLRQWFAEFVWRR